MLSHSSANGKNNLPLTQLSLNNIVEGKGFQELVQIFIRIGEKIISEFHRFGIFFTFSRCTTYGLVHAKELL